MRSMKKVASLALALVLCLSLSVGVWAGNGTHTITITNETSGHTYQAYQVFKGDYADGKLSNIDWGSGVNCTALLAELKASTDYKDCTTAADVANVLLGFSNDSDSLKTFAAVVGKHLTATCEESSGSTASGNKWTYTISVTGDGYYFIKDKDNTVTAEGDAYTAYMLQVVGNVNVNAKDETITSDKKIASDDYADNYDTDDSITTDGKASNGAIGSTVDFELTVVIPQNAASYSYYYCVLNDTLSEGLTFVESTVVVSAGTDTLVKDTDYKLYTGNNAGDKTFQIAMLNAKSLAGKTITVTYSATINENAVIGVAGNPNAFDVTYSNNPNYKYEEETENPDGKPGSDVPTGTTPEKQTYTYVTGIKLKKTDQDGNALTGAQFTITGTSVKYVLTMTSSFVEDEIGEYYKLKDGTYTKTAPSDATKDQYDNTTKMYKETVTSNVLGDTTDEEIKAYVGADGIVYFTGLGEGVYTIKETVTPPGFNTIDDITVTIDWTAPTTTATNCRWDARSKVGTAGNESILTLNNDGVFEITVVNQAGATLPETGGTGTTIFYVVGGMLAVLAAVLLITRKRMGTEN